MLDHYRIAYGYHDVTMSGHDVAVTCDFHKSSCLDQNNCSLKKGSGSVMDGGRVQNMVQVVVLIFRGQDAGPQGNQFLSDDRQ